MFENDIRARTVGAQDLCKTVIEEAQALGSVIALEKKKPTAVDIARGFAKGFGPNRVDAKLLMADPRMTKFRDHYGLREKHLRDAFKELRDAERRADSEKTGVTVTKRRRVSASYDAINATARDI